jgi:ABC-type bacteriocin/lantibiotic exporter with double-glycine peptidase domain
MMASALGVLVFIFFYLPIMLLGEWALAVFLIVYPLALLFAIGHVCDKYTRRRKAREAEKQSAQRPSRSPYAPQPRY